MLEDRTAETLQRIAGTTRSVASRLPAQVAAHEISRTAKVPFKIAQCRELFAWRAVELTLDACDTFTLGHVASGSTLARASLETIAALCFLRAKVSSSLNARTVSGLDNTVMQVLLGSRSSDVLPQSKNVLDFIDAADKLSSGFRRPHHSARDQLLE